MTANMVRYGFISAAMANIGGVLLCSRGFTNSAINQADPVVMSNFGLLMIIVWGLTYLAASTIEQNIHWIAGAFAIEKLVYVIAWIMWLSSNSLSALYAKDLFAGLFYTIYGPNDMLFLLFFAWVFFSYRPENLSLETN